MPFSFRIRNSYTPLPTTTASPTAHPPLRHLRKFAQRRGLLVLVAFMLFLFVLASSLHPSINSEARHRLGRIKGWGQNKTDGWKGSVQGWLPGNIREKSECVGWDPDLNEENDPVGCLKAKQYRQTQRVLAREEKGEHEHWFFTRDHNIETLRNITRCFLPVSSPDYTPCHEKPLIVSGWWYTAETLDGATTGEVIWQSSLVKQLSTLGYSYISVGPYVNWVEVAEMVPDVHLTLWNGELDTVSCVTDPRCIAKEHYVPTEGGEDLSIGVPDEERGVIPLWALNIVDYWGAKPKEISNNDYWWGLKEDGEWTFQPLGQEWIATPWPLPGNHYHLPYSIEEYCLRLPVTAREQRRDAALIFAKRSTYFYYHYVSPPEFWTNLSRMPDFDLLLTANEEEGKRLPEGLVSMGRQTREDYEALVGSVKVMVGMGAPPISPSVYTALCQATPVIIPYFHPNYRLDGWHLFSGFAQHGPALSLGEPYVYGYYAQNYTQLEKVVRRAMATPIERYIPDDMKLTYTLSQLTRYLDRDLKQMMDTKVALNGGKVPALQQGIRERCYELKRCREPLKAGRRPSVPPLPDLETGVEAIR
ncbi:hypothetical protein IAR55_000459 [Kwoniella newhampshirensis]|uniref:Glycosyltransferase family 18 catalytic domain-containing protein n=1 Tax=Kwoniella newhampshirensis TaxID=1651941 RepID=A0AAW0Z6Z2_9TREE